MLNYRRTELRNPRTEPVDKGLMSKPESAALLAKWFIQLQILPQYKLAGELLYGVERGEEDEG